MRIRVSETYSAIKPQDWNNLLADSNPFVRHEFLTAIEDSGCATPETGWQPCPVLCESAEGDLLGALPLYIKDHSQGEFVFDFAWASAYHQAGLNYYPKLVAAVPFTPATGARLLVNPGTPRGDEIRRTLLTAAVEMTRANEASSLHILFPPEADTDLLSDQNLMLRRDCQFHWHNRDYEDFDEFLQTFTSAKRKKTRRERRRINEYGIRFEVRHGDELDSRDWDQIMPLYRTTFIRRGREPYLNREFFERVTKSMPRSFVAILGYDDDEMVACSLCFRSDDTLYGRYWGANRFVDSLHFETCYYQGIDYCIAQGLSAFEPGTQGEHKISRGFVPALTWSAHWLSQPQFAAAVDDYLRREGNHIDRYVDAVWDHVPYRSESG
jgi:predicted N-acyltransferase